MPMPQPEVFDINSQNVDIVAENYATRKTYISNTSLRSTSGQRIDIRLTPEAGTYRNARGTRIWDIGQTEGYPDTYTSENVSSLYYRTNTSATTLGQVADWDEKEVLMLMYHDTNANAAFGPVIGLKDVDVNYPRNIGSSNLSFYGARLNNGLLEIGYYALNYFTVISSVAFTRPASLTKYWVRFWYDRTLNQLRVKVWNYMTQEPANPQLNATPLAGLPVYGVAGYVMFNCRYKYTVYVKQFASWDRDRLTTPATPVVEDGTHITSASVKRLVIGGAGVSNEGWLYRGMANADPDYYATWFPDEGNLAVNSQPTSTNAHNIVGWLSTQGAFYGYGGQGNLGFQVETANGSNVSHNTTGFGPNVAASTYTTTWAYNMQGAVNASPSIYFGTRGVITNNAGVPRWSGYAFRVIIGSTTVTLQGRPTGSGASTITTGVLGFTPQAETQYKVRVESTGSNVRFKMWLAINAEPGTWLIDVVNTTYGTTGQAFYCQVPAAGGFGFFDLIGHTLTLGSSATPSFVSSSTDSVSDIYYTLNYRWTGDNASMVTNAYRRVKGTQAWTALGNGILLVEAGPVNRKYWANSGLSPNTTYEYMIVAAHPNGVIGRSTIFGEQLTTNVGTHLPSQSYFTNITSSTGTLVIARPNDTDLDGTVARRYRKVGGAWSSSASIATGQPFISVPLTGLDPVSQYEVEITYTDPDGVVGTNPEIKSFSTIGNDIILNAINAYTLDTTATLTLLYGDDVNENASVDVQFKSVNESIWTSVERSLVRVDRTSKSFRVTLTGLKANTGYEIKFVASDPDILSAQPEISRTFITKGVGGDPDKRGKHFVYRVYSPLTAAFTREYLGAWNDGGDPDFSWEMDAGVSDISITLPREFNELHTDRTLTLGNAVDIWVVDSEGEGLGPNLVNDPTASKGSWNLATSWIRASTAGADGKWGMRYLHVSDPTVRYALSAPIVLPGFATPEIDPNKYPGTAPRTAPLVLTAVAKALSTKLRMEILAYDKTNVLLETSSPVETLTFDWEKLKIKYVPPANTYQVRVRFSNQGFGEIYVSKVEMLQTEYKIYGGEIDQIRYNVAANQQSVTVDCVGLVSYMSDDYIEFLQYAQYQQQRDIDDGYVGRRREPTDPANMIKAVIDQLRRQNPKFRIWYSSTSIQPTGVVAQYTFRDKQGRDCVDQARQLCPPGWHYYVDADGCFFLRSPDNALTHNLRVGIEIQTYTGAHSVRQLKNVVIFKGRQDSDRSEPGLQGTIASTSMDSESVLAYGRRVIKLSDSNITDQATAKIISDGRLEEYNVVEQSGDAFVPDRADIIQPQNMMLGYNIYSIIPGDKIQIIDPQIDRNYMFWDAFTWDASKWDVGESPGDVYDIDADGNMVRKPATVNRYIQEKVPITAVKYGPNGATVSISQRPPSVSGDLARLIAIQRRKDEG